MILFQITGEALVEGLRAIFQVRVINGIFREIKLSSKDLGADLIFA